MRPTQLNIWARGLVSGLDINHSFALDVIGDYYFVMLQGSYFGGGSASMLDRRSEALQTHFKWWGSYRPDETGSDMM